LFRQRVAGRFLQPVGAQYLLDVGKMISHGVKVQFWRKAYRLRFQKPVNYKKQWTRAQNTRVHRQPSTVSRQPFKAWIQ
jgi:hypothetical protein